jgi:outer membrane protein TolC
MTTNFFTVFVHRKQALTTFFLLAVLLLRGVNVAAQAEKMTLEQAISYAMNNVNSIKNAEMNIKDAEMQIQQNKATGLPQVNAELGYQYFFYRPQMLFPDVFSPAVTGILAAYGVRDGGGNPITPLAPGAPQKVSFVQRNQLNGSLSASQLVFSGSYLVALKAANFYRKLVDVQLDAKKSEVRYQVIDTYLPTLLITESLKTLDNNIANLDKLLGETRQIVKAGFAEQLDADRLELSLANLRVERENLARQKDIVLNALKMVIGFPMNQELDVADDLNALLIAQIDAEEAIKYENRKEYNVVNMGIEMSKLNIELNKAANLPTVVAFASWQESIVSDNYFTKDVLRLPTGVVGFKVSYNIWDNKEKHYKTERAKLAVRQLELQKADLERGIQLQVANAKIAITNAQKRVASQQKNLELAERIYKTTQIKYREGVGSSFEMVSAEQQVYMSQQNMRQAQYDLLVAQRNFLKALGK